MNQIILLKDIKNVEEIALTLNLSKRSVYKKIKEHEEGIFFVKNKPGRKFQNNDQIHLEIKKIVQEDESLTQKKIKEILISKNFNISTYHYAKN